MKGMTKHARVAAVFCLAVFIAASCARVGRNFPTGPVAKVKIGATTQADVRRMFGEPWRIGVDNGKKTWTYGYYRYSLFGETVTRDLVVTFRDDGVVDSYSFNTSEVDDERYR
ncbi:MAG: outer membrane protein assembly factor BamE [Candidatus Latescibacteria bacterium]|nr:outer membrane protein assembly factor BamE [Candidatus Latescibacterota bacterium]